MSVKDRVNSLVSETRKTFTQTPISASELPQYKVGSITFKELSEIITSAANSLVESGMKVMSSQERKKLLDVLFQSPRLPQWQGLDIGGGNCEQWRFYSKDDSVYVIVSKSNYANKTDVSLHKGERMWAIAEGLPAQSLWQALEQAQHIVSQATEEQTLTDEEESSYFEDGTEDYYDGAALDAALEETHAKPLSQDDADLIHDVTTEEALNQDQRELDGPEPIVTVSQAFIDDISEKHTTKMNKSAAAEGTQLKKEFPADIEDRYKDKPVQDCPRMEVTRVIAHLKSLQGNILNIVEASFADVEQRKAVKTLINKAFRHKMNNLNHGWSADED
jgi:hypothetical protein